MIAPHQLSETIVTCNLGRDDLMELMDLIKGGFPNPQNTVTKIALHLAEVQIDASNMTDFLNHPNLPDRIDNQFLITVYESTPQKSVTDTRWVLVQLYQTLNLQFFNVKGEERNWVIGTHTLLSRFFHGHQARFSFLRRKVLRNYDVFHLISDANIVALSISLIYFLITRDFVLSLAVAGILAVWSVFRKLYAQQEFLKPIAIYPKKKRRSITRDDLLFFWTVISSVAAVIAAMPVIQSWFQGN